MVESRFVDGAARAAPRTRRRSRRCAAPCWTAWDTIGEAIEDVVPVELHMRTYQMIESTPVPARRPSAPLSDLEEQIARVIAEREGLDLDARPAAPRRRRRVQRA